MLPVQGRVTTHVEDALRNVPGIDPTQVAYSVATGSTAQAIAAAPPGARAAVAHTARSAFIDGLNEIFLVAAIVAFAGAAAGFALVRRCDFVNRGAPAAARAR